MSTSFLKFWEFRADLFGLMMSDPLVNTLSTYAEDGSGKFETKGNKEGGGMVGGDITLHLQRYKYVKEKL